VAAIRREDVTTIFPETAVNRRLETAVAEEAGAKVGPALYADSLGPKGSPGATYLGALRHDAGRHGRGLRRLLRPALSSPRVSRDLLATKPGRAVAGAPRPRWSSSSSSGLVALWPSGERGVETLIVGKSLDAEVERVARETCPAGQREPVPDPAAPACARARTRAR
jgi:hypothetical protein